MKFKRFSVTEKSMLNPKYKLHFGSSTTNLSTQASVYLSIITRLLFSM